ATRIYLIGVRNLMVEVDVHYIKSMLSNPDMQLSASINQWTVAILMFYFELVHIKDVFHGPDSLSERNATWVHRHHLLWETVENCHLNSSEENMEILLHLLGLHHKAWVSTNKAKAKVLAESFFPPPSFSFHSFYGISLPSA
ncbi:hypothetical protein C0995_013936, partial [Termitomyces sp. Mi166